MNSALEVDTDSSSIEDNVDARIQIKSQESETPIEVCKLIHRLLLKDSSSIVKKLQTEVNSYLQVNNIHLKDAEVKVVERDVTSRFFLAIRAQRIHLPVIVSFLEKKIDVYQRLMFNSSLERHSIHLLMCTWEKIGKDGFIDMTFPDYKIDNVGFFDVRNLIGDR